MLISLRLLYSDLAQDGTILGWDILIILMLWDWSKVLSCVNLGKEKITCFNQLCDNSPHLLRGHSLLLGFLYRINLLFQSLQDMWSCLLRRLIRWRHLDFKLCKYSNILIRFKELTQIVLVKCPVEKWVVIFS